MKLVGLSSLLSLVTLACQAASIGDGGGGAGPDAGMSMQDPQADCTEDERQIWYRDFDGDGYGDSQLTHESCTQPAGYVASSADCDDTTVDRSPDAVELCGDLIDNDCSGTDACADSLIAHLTFDGLEGAQTVDATGGGHDAAPRGGASTSGETAVFDGVDDYFEVAHAADFAVDSGTVSLWFRTGDPQLEQGLWSKDSSGYDAGGHLTLRISSAGEPHVRLQSTSEGHILTAPAVSADAWHQMTASFGPAGLRLYLDGQLVGQSDYTGGISANLEPIVIGALSTVSGDGVAEPISGPLNGEIADVRSYARALSDDEIAELYQLSQP